jgi:hypothetical protein
MTVTNDSAPLVNKARKLLGKPEEADGGGDYRGGGAARRGYAGSPLDNFGNTWERDMHASMHGY